MGVRARVPSDSRGTPAVCCGEFDGMAVCGAAADVRRQCAAWRPEYAGLADGSVGRGRACLSVVAGGAEDGGRADADDSDLCGGVWRGADSVWSVACAVALVGADAVCGLWHDAVRGGCEYGDSVAGDRGQARACDELLHDGV